ncbi:RhoGAP-domain-containing protein [Anaeromyces robustus]|uniref:RhoGAP-domain-containing protein n=1 Tax=Anaeromyces robustus TaxID=1754192 RepID=A0A1Y1X9I1_9FUNG|nr:RhoGAP-domain-containing protein [Anaeromyces robustus]|eukprot:ORX82066.1 RhoGAP-domain-containing protein [Anaeromyces robustus]
MALNETLSSNSSLNNTAKNTSLSSINSNGGKESKCCLECKKPIKGKFVRALEGMFHLDCFRCMDCKEICLSKFFPYKIEDGTYRPLCENDYYKRLDLICAKCGNALLDSHINAIGKKYHVEHFCCAKCNVVFKSQDLYYEHNGDIYCQKDYSMLYASKCGSCRTSVLKQYIEYNNNKTKTIEKLHLDCYMIYKSWNVRMVPDFVPPKVYSSIEEEFEDKNKMEERVSKIWSILSVYMESAAECMSKLLNFVTSNSIESEIEQARAFIFHIEILFSALDEIENKMLQFNDSTGLQFQNEPKELVRKIIYFFSTLSHATNIHHDYTKEFLSLITLLAQALKILIRSALNSAINLEYIYHQNNVMDDFLRHMSEIEDMQRDIFFFSKYDEIFEKENHEMNTEYCTFCKQFIEGECISSNNYRWHKQCFNCSYCNKSIINQQHNIEGMSVKVENNNIILVCSDCIKDKNFAAADISQNFKYISSFKQSNILLRTALKRLYILCPPNTKMSSSMNKLKVTLSKNSKLLSKTKLNNDSKTNVMESSKLKDNNTLCLSDENISSGTSDNVDKTLIDNASVDSIDRKESNKTNKTELTPIDTKSDDIKTDTKPLLTPREINRYEFDNASDIGFDKYTESNNNFNNTYANPYVNAYNDLYHYNLKTDNNGTTDKTEKPNDNETKEEKEGNEEKEEEVKNGTLKGRRKGTLPDSIITVQRNATENYQQPICISSLPLDENQILFSDLSAFEMLAVGQKIVECLGNLLKEENISSQIDLNNLLIDKKETMWGKLLGSLKQNQKKQKVKDKTFGTSLEYITERHGIESKFGAGNGNIRVPLLIEKLISSMRGMDLNVEGIYRKNGNIKQLKILSDAIDKNPDEINLKGNSPIQLAALMKKFLRDLPNPVLTFKLYQLFIVSQKASTEENGMKILNYACCLLPKCYRDLLEVLLLFLKHISTLTDTNNNSGTKMNAENLATVIAPNILYSKYKDQDMDESMLAIKAVKKLIEHPELSYIVPENIVKMLKLNEEKENSGNFVINSINHGKTITQDHPPDLTASCKNSTTDLQNLESVQYDVAV